MSFYFSLNMKLPDFSASHLLVVGDVMLDTYWRGPVKRISPEAPVPVLKVEGEDIRVGGAGNVALNASVLGAQTHLLGLVGSDASADVLEQLLLAAKVRCQLQRVAGTKTIKKLRVLSRNQQLLRLDFEDDYSDLNNSELIKNFISQLSHVNVVVLSDYAKGTLLCSSALINAAREAGKPVVVDPKGTDFSLYKGATVITPNFAEFEAIVGHCHSETDIERRATNLRDDLMLDSILITRSEKGMTLFARGHSPLHLPARAQEVFDVTGAGDTVIATLASAIALGVDLPEAAMFANVAAGIVVSKLGTATVSPQELQRELNRESVVFSPGILDPSEVISQISAARNEGETIVMTNGCFDILHPGHIDYLKKASLLGDRLIVAVNDDASVKRLKGNDRPVNTLNYRMQMLDALSSVDWVVSFSEDTPERLCRELSPDVLVKGGDYTKEQIAGADAVEESGGSVYVIDFVEGHSTSDLINRIRNVVE